MSVPTVQDCINLIEIRIPNQYHHEPHALAYSSNPQKISDNGIVSLWCELVEGTERGSIFVHMMMPGITRFLLSLAQDGVGSSGVYKGVAFLFVVANTSSNTTTPITHISH